MAPRPYWKGHICLSLVAFPVQLHSATASGSRIAFHQIHRPTGQRVRHQKVVPEVGPVESDDIVKGFEVAKNQYITFEAEELEALRVESKHTIDLVQFVDGHEIDPYYFEKPYFVVPDGPVAQEAYRVVRRALADTRKVAVGQVVLGGRESLVAIQPCGKGLLLESLRSADEVKRGAPFFAEVEDGPVDEDQLALAQELVKRKSAPFAPERFVDHYEAALKELIKAKAEGQDISVDEPSDDAGVVIDLMQALKESLSEKPKAGARPKGKRTTAEVHELKPARATKAPPSKAPTAEAAASKAAKPKPPTKGAPAKGAPAKGTKTGAEPQPRRRKAG